MIGDTNCGSFHYIIYILLTFELMIITKHKVSRFSRSFDKKGGF